MLDSLVSSEIILFGDRVCPDIPTLAFKPLKDEEFFHAPSFPHVSNGKPKRPNIQNIKAHLLREGLLSDFQAFYLVECVLSLFKKEPNMLTLPVPINICGDVHGQFYDLVKIFTDDVGGDLSELEQSKDNLQDNDITICKRYLFLGDYVDRGLFSMECLFYLFALKITFPDQIFLLRGNHESAHMTQYFTFHNECTRKYSPLLYTKILDIFNALPLCAVVNDQLFCVHGGISPSLKSLKDIEQINRFKELSSSGLHCDLLWSDPSPTYDTDSPDGERFSLNRIRGCSYTYHFRAVMEFLNKNNLLCLIRAHEAQAAGYRMYKTNPGTLFPTVITLFSAPNYVDVYNNKAAIMYYDGKTIDIRQFSHNPHPYHLPNLMDAFSWSIPFVGEKISDMLLTILTKAAEIVESPEGDIDASIHTTISSNSNDLVDSEAQLEGEQEALTDNPDEQVKPTDESEFKKNPFVHKIRAVSKMIKSYNLLRTEREAIIELKALMRSDKLPCGTLALGAEGIRQAITSFDVARKSDIENEHIPPDSASATSMKHILTPSEVNEEIYLENMPFDSRDANESLKNTMTSVDINADSADTNAKDKESEVVEITIPSVVIEDASAGQSEDPAQFIYELNTNGNPSPINYTRQVSGVFGKFCKTMCGNCYNPKKK